MSRSTIPDVGESLVFRFTGDRERLARVQQGTERTIENLGPETRVMVVPVGMVDGNNVIGLFEKCVDNLIAAFKRKS